jgi:hypothetical protein
MRFPTNGLVFYAPLWHPGLSGSPFNAWDLVTPGTHSGTVTGATWTSMGWDFDGTNDLISVPNHAALNPTTGLTVAIWVNPDTLNNYDTFISKNSDTNWNDGYSIGYNANTVCFFITATTAKIPNVTFPAASKVNVWSFLVGTYDKANAICSLNGVAGTPVVGTADMTTNTAALEIGRGQLNTYNTDGTIGEVWICNRAWSPNEITQVYNATKFRYQ